MTTAAIGTSWRIGLLALLLAGCATTPDSRGPCWGKDPAAEAAATQGISPANPHNPYTGKDAYTNVVVDAGTVLYSLTPGAAPGFAVLEQTLRDAGGSRERYYGLVQVTSDPGKDAGGMPRTLRDKVRAFQVLAPLCAASGTASANPQFGSGGATQYYVPASDADKLRPAAIAPLSHWTPAR